MGKKRSKKKQNRVVTERLVEQVNQEADELDDKKDEASEVFSETISEVLNEDYKEVERVIEQDENISETEEVVVEEKIDRPNKFYLVFAVFVIVMSIIGIISTARFCVTTVKEIANQTSLKNEIALFLYPIVTVDPPEFSETSEIPSSVIVESAIWRIILTGDNNNYEKLYNTYMYVPAVDVEFSIKSIYGNSAVIAHQSVGSASATFTFDENMNAYLVPISPRYTAYSPVVADISNVGELYTVTVEYVPPTALAIDGIKLENTTTKTMIYTLSKSKKNMVVHSAKNATNLGDVNVY
ncbi:MAG: hypothetical protein IJZ65_01395 [Ruminiclostridium sp.]|nr:hypothetical protein [Ruminiclostridium sp.]